MRKAQGTFDNSTKLFRMNFEEDRATSDSKLQKFNI
jgi:hypothetical protein